MAYYFIGESAVCWPLGEGVCAEVSARVLEVYRRLKVLQGVGVLEVLDVVPSYDSVAVYFDGVVAEVDVILECVEAVVDEVGFGVVGVVGREVVLPVVYDGVDLGRVAGFAGLSEEEVVLLHVGGCYSVAMIGFLPHFPYLIGLDVGLVTPRLERPRVAVPAGSVGIGGGQTGVYPCVSPGGWNIVGCTDPGLLLGLEPGDRVVFVRS